MKIQTRPWAIASIIGTVIELVLGLGLSNLMRFVLPRLVADAQLSAATGMAMLSMGISVARLCLCGGVYGLFVGALYALSLPRNEYFTSTESALGGSLSAATASVTAGALSLFLGLLFLVAQVGPPLGQTAQLATLVITQLLSGIASLVVGGIVALMMGAAGSGAALAMTRRQE